VSRLDAENVGAVVVTDGDEPIGIVTDRDVALSVAEHDDVGSLVVEDVMVPDPVTIHEDEEAIELSRTIGEHGVRRIPVVDDGALTGIVSLDDLVATIGEKLDEVADTIETQSPEYTVRKPVSEDRDRPDGNIPNPVVSARSVLSRPVARTPQFLVRGVCGVLLQLMLAAVPDGLALDVELHRTRPIEHRQRLPDERLRQLPYFGVSRPVRPRFDQTDLLFEFVDRRHLDAPLDEVVEHVPAVPFGENRKDRVQ
jgi:hypothetical protein